MKRKAKLIVGSAALAIAAATGFAFTQRAAAPQVEFVALSGRNFDTSDLRGKVVLVNFWATSCASCVQEMPMLIRTQEQFGPRGYVTVAVAMSYDNPNQVAAFALKNDLPFRVAFDTSGRIAERCGPVTATPTSFLLDRHGRILKRYLGEPDPRAFHALLDKALRAPA